MDLSHVKGLGPTKQKALQKAGIRNVEDLAGMDLRRSVGIEGVSQENLKTLKQNARAALREAGKPIPKAPYRKQRSAGTPTITLSRKPQATKKTPEVAVQTEPPRRSFLGRLFARQ